MLTGPLPGQTNMSEKRPNWRRIAIFAVASGPFAALALAYLSSVGHFKNRAQKRTCLSRMVSIGFAARTWSNDHNDHFPRTLTEISNELSSPFILICSADPNWEQLREQMGTWNDFNEGRASYEVVNPGVSETNRDNIFFRCKIHGHLGYVDATVFDGTRRLSWNEAKGGVPDK